MPLAAGKLDRRIVLQKAVEARDDYNNLVASFVDEATVWASKQDISDRERISAGELGADITTRFQVRWSSITSRLTPKDRVTCEGKTYSISAVKEIGRREGIEITASARAD